MTTMIVMVTAQQGLIKRLFEISHAENIWGSVLGLSFRNCPGHSEIRVAGASVDVLIAAKMKVHLYLDFKDVRANAGSEVLCCLLSCQRIIAVVVILTVLLNATHAPSPCYMTITMWGDVSLQAWCSKISG